MAKTPTSLIDLSAHLPHALGIARRYAVVNGFDGALTMLGLLTGFRLGGDAAIALGVSGLTNAYLSEPAERRRALGDLEVAMVTDLDGSSHADAARVLPLLIAVVNGAAPLLVSLLIILPLWLAHMGIPLPLPAVDAAIATAFLCVFGLGAFLGTVGGTSWLWSGIKTLLIALVTMTLIFLL